MSGDDVPGDESEVAAVLDPRDLRVSDAEREHVAGLLTKAVGRGLITLDEFTERTDRALAARTRAELNSVLIDLSEIRHVDPAVTTDTPLVLRTRAGDVKQRGYWVVPSTITAECTMGNVTIDFTEASCPHREVTLHAQCGSGDITAIVPRGWHVVMVEAVSGMGNVVNKVTDPPDPAMPILRVHAKVGMGTVKIRYPRGGR